MGATKAATLDDLLREPGKAELVGGEVVRMPPSGGLHGYAALEVCASLREYARRTKSGHVFADNVGFVVDLPGRKSFSPDAAFYVGEVGRGLLEGAPIFAVEVRSPSDHGPAAERRLAAKRTDYFAAGTQVVWDVDLDGDVVVRVHRAADPERPSGYRRGETAEAEPAVPGWSMPVDALFP